MLWALPLPVPLQVHSTVSSVLVPSDTTMQSTDDVYSWLGGLLQVSQTCCLACPGRATAGTASCPTDCAYAVTQGR